MLGRQLPLAIVGEFVVGRGLDVLISRFGSVQLLLKQNDFGVCNVLWKTIDSNLSVPIHMCTSGFIAYSDFLHILVCRIFHLRA